MIKGYIKEINLLKQQPKMLYNVAALYNIPATTYYNKALVVTHHELLSSKSDGFLFTTYERVFSFNKKVTFNLNM